VHADRPFVRGASARRAKEGESPPPLRACSQGTTVKRRFTRLPSQGGDTSHCGKLERVRHRLRQPRASATRGRMRRHCALRQCHRNIRRWPPVAKASGRSSVARVPQGTQGARVDSVDVHAFAAEVVGTRDPDVNRAKTLPEKEVEILSVSVCQTDRRHFVSSPKRESGGSTRTVSDSTPKRLFGAALIVTSKRPVRRARGSGDRLLRE